MRPVACLLLALLPLLVVPARPAAAYVGWKLGAFTPTGDDLLHTTQFETGPMIGYSFRSWVAAELAVSYFATTAAHEFLALGVPVHPDLTVFPVTLSAILEQQIARSSMGRIGLYGFGGPGVFLTTFISPLEDSHEEFTVGYHYGVGIHIGAVGAEGRILYTLPSFQGHDVSVEGMSLVVYWAGGR